MYEQYNTGPSNSLSVMILAGLAGGFAEILWIGAISPMMAFDGAAVAREITASLVPGLRESTYSIFTGIGIHLVLSVLLAVIYFYTINRLTINRFGLTGQLISGILTLVVIWAVNFFVVLPLLNPAFVELLAYGPSLISKILFAVAMVLVITYHKKIQYAHETGGTIKFKPVITSS